MEREFVGQVGLPGSGERTGARGGKEGMSPYYSPRREGRAGRMVSHRIGGVRVDTEKEYLVGNLFFHFVGDYLESEGVHSVQVAY